KKKRCKPMLNRLGGRRRAQRDLQSHEARIRKWTVSAPSGSGRRPSWSFAAGSEVMGLDSVSSGRSLRRRGEDHIVVHHTLAVVGNADAGLQVVIEKIGLGGRGLQPKIDGRQWREVCATSDIGRHPVVATDGIEAVTGAENAFGRVQVVKLVVEL